MSGGLQMSLRELFDGIAAAPERPVSGLSADSRRVRRGELFLARAGERSHGLDYLDFALEAGVAAVAWEPAPGRPDPALPGEVAGVRVPGLSARLGTLGDRFYRKPSARIAVTGITGTNGKTTTAWLSAQALARCGRDAAYLGTLGYGRLAELAPSTLTTPDCIEFHRRLHELAAQGVQTALAEISSHALAQGRVDGVRFAVAALTNFSRDHLDYHGTVEAYAAAKSRLFLEHAPRRIVLNVGDGLGRRLVSRLPADARPLTTLLAGGERPSPRARLIARQRAAGPEGIRLELGGEFGEAVIESPLWGRFNAENLSVAAGILLAHDCGVAEVAAGLAEAVAPPGRMQKVPPVPGRPAVIVDYAHTPDALNEVLLAVRAHCRGRVWCVFGCGGERDRGKRALMAAVAERHADRIIVTDDNPRGEDPARIVADVLEGLAAGARVEVRHDRARAIRLAVDSAGPDDAVLIAGKGHETRQLLAGRSRPFSDFDVAKRALEGAR